MANSIVLSEPCVKTWSLNMARKIQVNHGKFSSIQFPFGKTLNPCIGKVIRVYLAISLIRWHCLYTGCLEGDIGGRCSAVFSVSFKQRPIVSVSNFPWFLKDIGTRQCTVDITNDLFQIKCHPFYVDQRGVLLNCIEYSTP